MLRHNHGAISLRPCEGKLLPTLAYSRRDRVGLSLMPTRCLHTCLFFNGYCRQYTRSDAAETGAEVAIDPVELRQDVETQPKSVLLRVRQSTDVCSGWYGRWLDTTRDWWYCLPKSSREFGQKRRTASSRNPPPPLTSPPPADLFVRGAEAISFGPFFTVSMNVRMKGGYFNEQSISCVMSVLNINVFNAFIFNAYLHVHAIIIIIIIKWSYTA